MAGRRRHTERHRAASAIDRLLFGTELARGEHVQLEEGGVAASEAGFYVVAPDLRSYGRSDGTDVSFADDLRQRPLREPGRRAALD